MLSLWRPQSQLWPEVLLAQMRKLQALLLLLLFRLQPQEVQPHMRRWGTHFRRVQNHRTLALWKNQVRMPMAKLQENLLRFQHQKTRVVLRSATKKGMSSRRLLLERKDRPNGERAL